MSQVQLENFTGSQRLSDFQTFLSMAADSLNYKLTCKKLTFWPLDVSLGVIELVPN